MSVLVSQELQKESKKKKDPGAQVVIEKRKKSRTGEGSSVELLGKGEKKVFARLWECEA